MKSSKLLKRPIRFSVITIAISMTVFLVTSIILFFLDRIINSQNELRCQNIPNCFQVASIPMQIVHTVVYDFRTLAEYAVEIAVLFVIVQFIYRVVKHRKSSRIIG